jgi:hypothetical protein
MMRASYFDSPVSPGLLMKRMRYAKHVGLMGSTNAYRSFAALGNHLGDLGIYRRAK